MRNARSAVALLLMLAFCWTDSVRSEQSALPDRDAFVQRVRDAIRRDYQTPKPFVYIERRRDVKLSRLGKVTVGPLRTFEVFPSHLPGQTYKRLIAVDGKPLDASELARRDEEHRDDLERTAERERNETPSQRAARLEEEAKERRHRDAVLDDALAVFEATLAGRETLEGHRVVVVDVTPRKHVDVKTREGRWLKHFAGRLWIAEADHHIVKLDLRAVEDVTIGWGIVGRLHEGSRLVHLRRQFQGAWLPAELLFEGSGRTLLFRRFEISLLTTYSDYQKHTAAWP